MDTVSIFTILNGLFGASGVFAYLKAYKKEKTETFQIMQRVYKTFIEDTEKELEQMKQEIKMLHDIVKGYRDKCDACTKNNK